MSTMIPETCWAIYNCLKHYIKMPSSDTEWKNTAKMFEEKWNFGHCVGAMDGKHIAVEKPPGSGSCFFNYKQFFSVVLFAIVNANYEFINKVTKYYTSSIYNNISAPYVFVEDSAFALNRHLMKPYPFKNINHDQRIFNYRLSRARRVVENAFGILAARYVIGFFVEN
ncbi:hypothetical protein evm_010073 [Chilo suppressalis]|nr:hypothetical protein evm_010073 [Chilo suppressalis]